MSTAQCSVSECTNSHWAKGLCDKHYQRMRKHGSPTYTAPRVSDLTCDADGCDKARAKRNWCGKHYLRWYKHGNANHERTSYHECTADDCTNPPRSRTSEYCEKHYYRMRRNGNMALVDTRLPVATYRALHSRIARDRGVASSHPCVDCGTRAQHWSYTHNYPHELTSPGGQPYSMDVDNYEPRCSTCHALFDGVGRNQYSA